MNPQPREKVDIRIQSRPDAFIGLMAVKESSTIHKSNDINDERVREEIFSYFLGKNVNKIDVADNAYNVFGESNSLIITNAKADGFSGISDCVNFSKRSLDIDYNPDNTEMEFKDNIPRRTSLHQNQNQPDTWLFEDIELDRSGIKTLRKQLPGQISSYIMTAFSIHPEQGLSLSKPLRINTANDFYVEIQMPTVVYEKDMIKIELFIYNFKDTLVNVYMRLNANSDEFQLQKETRQGKSSCTLQADNSTTHGWSTSDVKTVKKFEFYVQAIKAGTFDFTIQSSDDSNFGKYYSSSKLITILSKDEERGETKARFFDLRQHNFSSFYFTFENQNSKALKGSFGTAGFVAGNVIGPSMDVKKLKNSM